MGGQRVLFCDYTNTKVPNWDRIHGRKIACTGSLIYPVLYHFAPYDVRFYTLYDIKM